MSESTYNAEELRKTIFQELSLNQTLHDYTDETNVLIEVWSDDLVDFITSHTQTVREEAEKALLSRLYNLANEYANKDKTMVGSESLRGYHYFNALETVKIELDHSTNTKPLEPKEDI